MIIEAIQRDNGYFIPINGQKEKIKVYIQEDIEKLDIISFMKNKTDYRSSGSELTKDEFREQYGDELYRKHLLLDQKSMEENWEYLVRTKSDFGSDFEMMEEAISNWNKE